MLDILLHRQDNLNSIITCGSTVKVRQNVVNLNRTSPNIIRHAKWQRLRYSFRFTKIRVFLLYTSLTLTLYSISAYIYQKTLIRRCLYVKIPWISNYDFLSFVTTRFNKYVLFSYFWYSIVFWMSIETEHDMWLRPIWYWARQTPWIEVIDSNHELSHFHALVEGPQIVVRGGFVGRKCISHLCSAIDVRVGKLSDKRVERLHCVWVSIRLSEGKLTEGSRKH